MGLLHWLLGTRLEIWTKLIPIDVVAAVLAVLVILPLRRTAGSDDPDAARVARRHAVVRLAATVGGAGLGVLACWIMSDVLDAFDVAFSTVVRMWVALAVAGLALGITALVQGGWLRRFAGVTVIGFALLAAGLGVNVDFAAYPTLNALLQESPYGHLPIGAEAPPLDGTPPTLASWRAPTDLPAHGRVGWVRIPGSESGFPARKAVVYLPPAALTTDPPRLPVVLSLSGQPGTPSDMFSAGRLAAVMDTYADAHHGIAPIIISADQLAVPGHNPMCVDSPLGNAATYILRDVPDWAAKHLRVQPISAGWGVMGFSEGGTCTMQFSAGYPQYFTNALAISSERVPMNGDRDHTIRAAFGGSASRYRAATPEGLMAANAPYSHHFTTLAWGGADREYRSNARELARAARRAGITTSVLEAPGSGHDWNTVHYALEEALPTIADRLIAADRS